MRRVPFLLVVGISLVVLFGSTGSASGSLPAGSDVVAHVALFAALAWTGRLAGVPILPLLAALLAYAVLSEVLQGHLPWAERTSSGWDVLADCVGIALGLVVPVPRRGREADRQSG